MWNGNKVVSKPEGNGANGVTPELQAFADQLLNLPQVIEVAAAVHPLLFEVECTAVNPIDDVTELEPEELDTEPSAGDSWFLVRVRIPNGKPRGGLVSFIPHVVVGNEENGSGDASSRTPRDLSIMRDDASGQLQEAQPA